jgi:hypothetical protein
MLYEGRTEFLVARSRSQSVGIVEWRSVPTVDSSVAMNHSVANATTIT